MQYELDLKTALTRMQSLYEILSVQARDFQKIMQETQGKLPQDVIETHNIAVRNYLDFGQQVFANTERLGLQVEQIKLKDGVPEKVLYISAPLIPAPALPGLFSPPQTTVVGFAIPAGVLAIGGLVVTAVRSPLFATLAKWIIGGYLLTEGLQQIKIILQGYHDNFEPIKQGQAIASTYKAAREAGASGDEALKLALTAGTPPPPRPTQWTGIAMMGIAVAGGAFVLSQVLKSKG